MLSVIISLPGLFLLLVFIYTYFNKDDTEKVADLEEVFNLTSPIVKAFYWIVVASVVVWIVSFLLPVKSVYVMLDLLSNLVAIVWFIQCLYSGKVSTWISILKDKFKSE